MNNSKGFILDSDSESDNPFAPPKNTDKYAENENIDNKFAKVRKEIDNTKDQVLINIDKAMQRGDELQPLVDRTTELSDLSFKFKRQTHKLRRQIWCDNLQKRTCLIVMVLLTITTVILIIVYSTKKH
jgi:hypothetical protein